MIFWKIPKPKLRVDIRCLLAAMLAPCLLFGHGHAQVIEDIRLGEAGAQTRAVIEFDRPLGYQIFYLSSPPRIVVDIRDIDFDAGFSPDNRSVGLVRNVRLGQFNARVARVVFDLKESATLIDTFFLNPQGGAAYRLVLDMQAGAAAANGTVLAERAVAATTAPTSPSTPDQSQGAAQSAPVSNSSGSCASCETVLLPPRRPANIAPQRYIIVIDPGHGGRDPGAVGPNGVEEADVVLDMAVEISNELRASGNYEVYLTRGTDRLVPLRERAELARGRAADFFLSIHANANPDPDFRGFMVFTLSDSASDSYAAEVAARENRSELGAIATIEDDDVETILGDILFRDTLNQSIDFASRLVGKLRGKVRLPKTPQRRAGFVVLKSVRMPSALLEIGHLTNRTEARALQNAAHRRKIAIAVRQALDDHFSSN